MYNQNYINTVKEQYLEDIFNKRIPLPSINSDLCSDKQVYLVFQHYLIKKIVENKDKTQATEFLLTYYTDLINYPHLFVSSPLISNKVIDLVIKDQDLKEDIKGRRNIYYDQKFIPVLSEKSKRNQLSITESEQYYAILIHNLKNPKYQSLIEEEIDRIIDRATISPDGTFKDTGIRNLKPMELQFYTQYLTNFSNQNKFIPVIIGKAGENLNGYENGEIVYLNREGDAASSLAEFTKTTFHEARHTEQEKDAREVVSKKAIEMIQNQLFIKYLPEKYDSYSCNYKHSMIELDAEKLGYYNASLFFYIRKKKELNERVKELRQSRLSKRNLYAFMKGADNKPISVDKYITENFDRILREHPEEISNYPALAEIYNQNGTRRSIKELLLRRRGKIAEENVYTNFINQGIRDNELETIDFNNTPMNQRRDILKGLSNVFRDYIVDNLFEYGKDNPGYSIPTGQVITTTNYSINQAIRILDHIDKNFDKYISAYKGEHLDHKNPMFDFIYDLRDHTIDKITNPVLMNSDAFKKKYEELKSKVDNIISKYNKAYTESRLEYLGKDNLSKVIEVKGVGSITVEDYLYNYLIPNMNSHQYVIINGKECYISDLLTQLKQYTESTENKNQK